MKDKFIGFIGYTDTELKDLWENAVFVVDTNILINFYKYTSKESTKSLLDILKKLKENNRLWIPHQVALEYFFNYESNMHKQQEGLKFLQSELTKLKDNANKAMSNVKSQHPYITTDKFQFFINNLEESNKQLETQIAQEIENLPDVQTIHIDLLKLLDGIIGEPYEQKRIDDIENKGKTRYEHKVPPGFEDMNKHNKNEFRSYGDFRYQQLYGDLIVWNQIIDRGNAEGKPTSIIFITEDRKCDWWELDNQKRIKRPHPLLLQEFLNKTKQSFYMYRTESFVELSKKFLDTDLTDEQVKSVTEDVENIRKIEEQNDYTEQIQSKVIDKTLDYLTNYEKQQFIDKLQKVQKVDSAVAPIAYKTAITYALETALPKIESAYFEKAMSLSTHDATASKLAFKKFDSMPKELNNKVYMLLNEIEILNNEIRSYRLEIDSQKVTTNEMKN
ncbi:hypothetical protein COK07_24150 [Bacillus thuringiensis]|uniref:PIN-like domain-containing protein n=1 Tax=Bacillus TaxID=1386 RepID=UPI000BF91B78|nr:MULTISPECIES: PIN-like domain-containing protein [Bacillus]MCP1324643.1 PIN-like domain-containing protein [Bacillus sp. S0628]PFI27327.1 hypothetical protein COI53_24605 [Bacillus thuringiensis]PFP73372.1 hypothetical protein COK07_24150 [Bacillus thuringiensis]